jgi:hypothetical protein
LHTALNGAHAEGDIRSSPDGKATLAQFHLSDSFLFIEQGMFLEKPLHPPQLNPPYEKYQDDACGQHLVTVSYKSRDC